MKRLLRADNLRTLLPRVLILAWMLTALAPAAAQSQSEISGCYYFSLQLANSFPALCDHSVHWIIAADRSGSMMGPRLDAIKGFLRLWTLRMLAPGDQVSLIAFDDEVPDAVTWPVGPDRSGLIREMMELLKIRPNRTGTDLKEVQEKALTLATTRTHGEPPRLPFVLILADRDDNDAVKGDEQWKLSLQNRFGDRMAHSQSAGRDGPTEGEYPLDIAPESKSGMVAIFSGSRDANSVPSTLGIEREIPLLSPISETIPHPDPFVLIRWIPGFALILSFGWLLYLIFRLNGSSAGKLSRRGDLFDMSLPWSLKENSRPIRAGRNLDTLTLAPFKDTDGIEGTTLLQARLDNPLDKKKWKARLTVVEPYRVQLSTGAWTDSVTLEPEQEIDVLISGQQPVASGSIVFHEERASRNKLLWIYRTALLIIVMVVLSPIWFILTPKPPEPESRVISVESFCSETRP